MNVERLFDRKILIAEDEYFIAFDLADFLERAGADVIGPVSNVADAVHLVLKSRDLDCAVIDVHLQGGQSFALADALQANGKPFVFLTGYDREELEKKYPGVPVLSKPCSYDELARTLGEMAN